jgi:O-antigen biosynthesis protein
VIAPLPRTSVRQIQVSSDAVPHIQPRVRVRGKFLWAGDEKFYVRGVTYGPFPPSPDGTPLTDGISYPAPKIVDRDFAQIAANGLNTIRTYDVPPQWLLDAAAKHGLRLIVGLQIEQLASFFDDPGVMRRIEERVRSRVRVCAGHPALLAYIIANEIPAPVARWHGAKRIESLLGHIYKLAKSEDPEGIVCYANYPSTEHLELGFLDLLCFNVYLESRPAYESYLARLQVLAGERPLLISEVGLDSQRNGLERQAHSLRTQLRSAFAAGCAGAVVFAWTDRWYSRGRDVDDWDFGLTDRERKPKPALAAVREAFADTPFPADTVWPRISVVVCTYNGGRTIRECLEGLGKLNYPDYEVIVVNDGSTDRTASIASEFSCRLISTENRGLSAARNTGMVAAKGEIVAYIDDDASPDPDWLNYLAITFRSTGCAAAGGPNLPFPGEGQVANCVATLPGRPTHVLLTDTEAEHVAGCNMAFRKDCLQSLGGFDKQFRAAGDDVDICWRVRERGGKIAFCAAAMVWHHCRNSARAYRKQQFGYGKAEALLEKKWPEKFNSAGHIRWAGRIYSEGLIRALERSAGRIYQGTWGSAAYTRLYYRELSLVRSMALMPEWWLAGFALALVTSASFLWKPLLLTVPVSAVVVGAPLLFLAISVWRVRFPDAPRTGIHRFVLQCLAAILHLAQLFSRLNGRIGWGLTPWRNRRPGLCLPRSKTFWLWSPEWKDCVARLEALESALRGKGVQVRRGGDFDAWDLEVRSGLAGDVRLLMADEFNLNQQLVRVRFWPRWSAPMLGIALLFAMVSVAAAIDHAPAAAAVLGAMSLALGGLLFQECAGAALAVRRSLEEAGFGEGDKDR